MKYAIKASRDNEVGYITNQTTAKVEIEGAYMFIRKSDAKWMCATTIAWAKAMKSPWKYEVVEIADEPLPLPG